MLLLLTNIFYFISTTKPPTEFDDDEFNAVQNNLNKTMHFMDVLIQDLKNQLAIKNALKVQIKEIEKIIELKSMELAVLKNNLEKEKSTLDSSVLLKRENEIAEKEKEIKFLEENKEAKKYEQEKLNAEGEAAFNSKINTMLDS